MNGAFLLLLVKAIIILLIIKTLGLPQICIPSSVHLERKKEERKKELNFL